MESMVFTTPNTKVGEQIIEYIHLSDIKLS